jgi:hypothetical protein
MGNVRARTARTADAAGLSGGVERKQAAVGVMAHEVAHAWRNEKHLVADAREREELLTDLTTIYLGFGVLSTNSTDRYRSSGGYGYTSWSVSSLGYLPPNAMAWLLALQATARDDRDEQRAIERHLEPNQKACFRAAMSELANEASWIEALRLPPRDTWPARAPLTPATIVEPDEDEVAEPPKPEPPPPVIGVIASTIWFARRSTRFVCGDRSCKEPRSAAR